jgi:hypothetical protein
MCDAIPYSVEHVSDHRALFALEMLNKRSLREFFEIGCESLLLSEVRYPIEQDRRTQTPLNGFVKSYLPQRRTSIRVCGEQSLLIWINKYSQGNLAHTQKNLRGRLMLTVEDADTNIGKKGCFDPSQGYVKLRPLFEEFLDKTSDVCADRAWVDSFVVMNCLNRQRSEEVTKRR